MNIGKLLWKDRSHGHSTQDNIIRFLVRDTYHDTCVLCHRIYNPILSTIAPRSYFSRIHIDHIVPFSRGGKNHISNYQLLCAECNLRKSNTIPEGLDI